MAQSVERLALAQVNGLTVCEFELALGSVLTAQNLETISDSVSPSLLLPCSCSVSLSLKNK